MPPPNNLFNIGGFTDSAVLDDINDFANLNARWEVDWVLGRGGVVGFDLGGWRGFVPRAGGGKAGA